MCVTIPIVMDLASAPVLELSLVKRRLFISLARFGENRFTNYLEGEHPIMFSSIKLPEKLTITCRRYENERIRLEPYEDTTWVRIASELRIEGPRFSPLKSFRIALYITRITLGEPLLLRLEYNCRSVAVEPDRIECVDKNGRHILITGEEREKLSSWVKIDFGVAILAEIRPYLFVHPVFGEILTWLRNVPQGHRLLYTKTQHIVPRIVSANNIL